MSVEAFKIIDPEPKLKNTCAIAMLRPWIDVGRVGTLVLKRLERHLGAKELGRLTRPGTFFDFTRYRPRTRLVDGCPVFTKPNSVINYAQDEENGRDYLFLHLREPHMQGEDYAEAIVSLLERFDINQYFRIGGMYDTVPHTRSLLVTGSLPEDQAQQANGLVSPNRSTYQGPTSIVNLVSENLSQSNIITTSLMAHLPQYVKLDEDHMGASRLMEVLCAIYDFPKSLADPTRGQQQYMDISRAVEANPEVKKMIDQLETYYDRVLVGSELKDEIPLAPDVEKFLTEVGKRLENEQESNDA